MSKLHKPSRHPHPMNATEFSALLLLATASSFTPGPNTTLSAALAANGGLKRALRFVCAVPVGWGLMLALCSAGLGALVLAAPSLRLTILLAGVVYLLSLAWRLAQRNGLANADTQQFNVTFWQGVGFQFLNIKAWMLALSISVGWIAGHADAPLRFVQVLPLMLAFAFGSNFAYAWLGACLRHWLAGPWVEGLATAQRLKVFNRVMAVALALTAWWMLWMGLELTAPRPNLNALP